MDKLTDMKVFVAVALTAAACALLYRHLKRKGWMGVERRLGSMQPSS